MSTRDGSQVRHVDEVRRVADATAVYRGGRLIATAMYSMAGRCWNVTDERTARHVGRFEDRATAELHLGLCSDSDGADHGSERRRERLDALHSEGVHVECRPAWVGWKVGRGSPDGCPHAGAVERFHGHGYEGPLVCGCPEWAS